MPIKARRWRGRSPPIASTTLMGLLCVFWLMGIGDSLALAPSLLSSPWQLLSSGPDFPRGRLRIFLDSEDWAGVFSPLELPEACLEDTHNWMVHRMQAGGSGFGFVLPPAAGVLPLTDPAATMRRISPASPSTSYWSGEEQGQEPGMLFASPSLPPFLAPPEASDGPFSALTDDEQLQAGIRASLQDMAKEEVQLSKSSVSSLRLQQLQKMGFPTNQSVVALAATGHVEGAVSLLIGGHVGDKMVVMSERPQQPLSGHRP